MIGQYSLTQSMPNIQIGKESMLNNNGIQNVVMPKTVADKKTSSQEDGSHNKSKGKTPSTTRKNKAKLGEADLTVNPFPKKPISKMRVGTGKLKKQPKHQRKNKRVPHKSGHNSKHIAM